jgi:thioredoxin reductase (NADPH)
MVILAREVTDEFDVVVAGGGIGGLTAGLYAARAGRSTLVLGGRAPGGLLLSIEQIEGLPGFPDGVPGYELCPMLQEQAADTGADVRMFELAAIAPADGGWLLTTDEGDVHARALIVATGARLKALGVDGEERLQGRGVSHCASCDAPLMRDRVVGVVGGGDSALQEALTLAESVANVIVLHRGDELTAQATYRRRALEHPNITVRYGTIVEEILGDDTVTGVRTRDADTGATDELELGGVFVYVGLQPNTEPLADLLTHDGRVTTDAAMRTTLPGVLAAGILRRGSLGQAAISAGEGAAAAKAADRYLADGEWARREGEPAAAATTNGGSHG